MDFAVFDQARPEVTLAEAELLAAELYGVAGTARALPGERDRAFKITGEAGAFVLKVANPADRSDALEAQSAAIAWVRAADPELPVPPVIPTGTGELTGRHRGHRTQLTAFLDGGAPADTETPPGFRRNVGTLAARMSRALRGFDHPLLHRPFPWNLTRLPELRPLLEFLDKSRQGLVESTLGHFETDVVGRLRNLAHQAVHGDLHNDNLVVDRIDCERIAGVFDFGDMSWAPRVVELAVAATYQCFGADSPPALGQVASAFHQLVPLYDDEIELLADLVAGRCVQSLLMSARHAAIHPENTEYAMEDADSVWEALEGLSRLDGGSVIARIARACGRRPSATPPTLANALALRAARLGPALHLSYGTPVRLQRGEGVWLIDTEDNRLLDAYNNVPHVGHSHPEVVAAVTAQLRRLTTNTRYLVDEVARYADRLVRLLPPALDTVMFVNSGSEANDLAYQIARVVTGRRGVITTEYAYHGTTLATVAMSPEEFGPQPLEPWAATVPGAPILASPEAAGLLLSALDEAQERLVTHAEEPAMVIFDTVASSEGIYPLPDGYLVAARRWADRAGALLVADEVQAGFGRVGTQMWGFATDDVVPDIVTLGKPMGNGYPMGAVVTSAELAEEFAAAWHFFSTFAGSPVAAAAGGAVLDVMEAERLPERAEQLGAYLRAELVSLRHPAMGAVRGSGLFVGVEMADSGIARAAVEGLRQRRVLIGSTGPAGEVLKIRPPLVFTKRHADLLIAKLAETLAADPIAGRLAQP